LITVITLGGEYKSSLITLGGDLYSSPSVIRIIKLRRMRWAGHVAVLGEKRHAYRLLVGKRPRQKWVDNIRMDLGEPGWGGVDWIGLAHDRDKCRAREFGDESLGSIKCWETIEWLHFSSTAELH
jgi:hypothetical protein